MKTWKRLLALTLALGLTAGMMLPAGAADGDTVTLSAAQAEITGKGVSRENKMENTVYDETTGTVTNVGTGSTVTFTVPDGVDGTYDVYLTVSKCLSGGSSTPFGLSVNGSKSYAFPLDYQVSGDSPFAYNVDGEYDVGSITDTGRFLIKSGLELKAGDTITITGMYGARSAALAGLAYPDVGDILLAKPGTQVATGYDNTVKPVETVDPTDPLSGLDIIWLGSSVTYGAQAGGYYSMADAIADNHAATVCEKYAINGTTLTNLDAETYVSRMKTIDPTRNPDLFVVQLSTNDATSHKPYGEMTDSFDPSTFDDTTIIGAMETILAYVQTTFDCPVIFYTGSYYDSEEYAVMVEALLKLQEKWGFGIVDLFNNEAMTAIYDTEQYHAWMSDTIHPFRGGYIEWWTPAFEEYFTEFLAGYEKESEEFAARTVTFDGKATDAAACVIDGSAYIKLRDAASLLAGSDYAFNVSYDAASDVVSLTAGEDYTAVGGELSGAAAGTPAASSWTFQLDGKPANLRAYTIGGANYCRLGDLASLLGFVVGADDESGVLYLTTAGSVYELAVNDADEAVIPLKYTKSQTVVFEKLGIDILVCMNEEETEFYLTFNAFGNDQLLYGTIADGVPTVEYDLTGFFTNDTPTILGSVKDDAWEMVIQDGIIPAKYTKTQTVVFEKLGIDIQVYMNEEETEFYMVFNAFGNDQLLYGTMVDGVPTVEYDLTGFFTNDAPTILGSVKADAWQKV